MRPATSSSKSSSATRERRKRIKRSNAVEEHPADHKRGVPTHPLLVSTDVTRGAPRYQAVTSEVITGVLGQYQSSDPIIHEGYELSKLNKPDAAGIHMTHDIIPQPKSRRRNKALSTSEDNIYHSKPQSEKSTSESDMSMQGSLASLNDSYPSTVQSSYTSLTDSNPPTPSNILQYLGDDPGISRRRQRRQETERLRPRSYYEDKEGKTTSADPAGVQHSQSASYVPYQFDPHTGGMLKHRRYPSRTSSQDEVAHKKPSSQLMQRGSWDGSKASLPIPTQTRARDHSLDTSLSRRGDTLPVPSSGDLGRWSRDSSMESLGSSGPVVRSSQASLLAYSPRRAKPFTAMDAAANVITTTGSTRDVSQTIPESLESSFVAPWRRKERPNSQTFEPTMSIFKPAISTEQYSKPSVTPQDILNNLIPAVQETLSKSKHRNSHEESSFKSPNMKPKTGSFDDNMSKYKAQNNTHNQLNSHTSKSIDVNDSRKDQKQHIVSEDPSLKYKVRKSNPEAVYSSQQPSRKAMFLKTASFDEPFENLRNVYCDSPDLDELVEANLEAAAMNSPVVTASSGNFPLLTSKKFSSAKQNLPPNYTSSNRSDGSQVASSAVFQRKPDTSAIAKNISNITSSQTNTAVSPLSVDNKKRFQTKAIKQQGLQRSKTLPDDFCPPAVIHVSSPVQAPLYSDTFQIQGIPEPDSSLLQPPEEDKDNLSDFEKHLLELKSELKTPPPKKKTFKKNLGGLDPELALNIKSLMGIPVVMPQGEDIDLELEGPPIDEKVVIAALKEDKPALAELLEKDREEPQAKPKYHDDEIAEKIALAKQKENKKKHLLFKLGVIRKELSSRIGSLESRVSRPMLKSKSLGEETFMQRLEAANLKNKEIKKEPTPTKQQERRSLDNSHQSTSLSVMEEKKSHSPITVSVTSDSHTPVKSRPFSPPVTVVVSRQTCVAEQSRPISTPITGQAKVKHRDCAVTTSKYFHDRPVSTPIATSNKMNNRVFSPEFGTSYLPKSQPSSQSISYSGTGTSHQPSSVLVESNAIYDVITSISPYTTPITSAIMTSVVNLSTSVCTHSSFSGITQDTHAFPKTSVSSVFSNQSTKMVTTTSLTPAQQVVTVTTSSVTVAQSMPVVTVASSYTGTEPISVDKLSMHGTTYVNKEGETPHGALSLVQAIESRLKNKTPTSPVTTKSKDIGQYSKHMDITTNSNVHRPNISSQKQDTNGQHRPDLCVKLADKSDIVQHIPSQRTDLVPHSTSKIDQASSTPSYQLSPRLSERKLHAQRSEPSYFAKTQETGLSSQKSPVRHAYSADADYTTVLPYETGPQTINLDNKTLDTSSVPLAFHNVTPVSQYKRPLSRDLKQIQKPPEFGISYIQRSDRKVPEKQSPGAIEQVISVDTSKQTSLTEKTSVENENYFKFPIPSVQQTLKKPDEDGATQGRKEKRRELNQVKQDDDYTFQQQEEEQKQRMKLYKEILEKQDEADIIQQREQDEKRRIELYREDSFTHETSPEYSPIPLPKDSVIMRNKFHCIERRDSTSDESDVTVSSVQSSRSPRLSPRTMRKTAQAQKLWASQSRGSTSSGVGVDYLNIPGTPNSHTKENRSARNTTRGSTTSLPATRHAAAGGGRGSRENVWSVTPPSSPRHKKSGTFSGAVHVPERTGSNEVVVTGSVTPDNIVISDSSTTAASTRANAKRHFRKKDRDSPHSPQPFVSEQVKLAQSTTANTQQEEEKSKDTDVLNKPPKEENSVPVIKLKTEPVIEVVEYKPAYHTEQVIENIQYKPKVEITQTSSQQGKVAVHNKQQEEVQTKQSVVPATINSKQCQSPSLVQQTSSVQAKSSPVTINKCNSEIQSTSQPLSNSQSPSPHQTSQSLTNKPTSSPASNSKIHQYSKTTKEQYSTPEPAISQQINVIRGQLNNSVLNVDRNSPPKTVAQIKTNSSGSQLPTTQITPKKHVETDSDPELKGNRQELDSAIQTLDELAKELEDRRKEAVKQQTDDPNAKRKSGVFDVNDALLVLSASNDLKSINRLGGNRTGQRPSPLTLSQASNEQQKVNPSNEKISPLIVETKQVQSAHSSAKGQKASSSPRTKGGIGVGLLQRAQEQQQKQSSLEKQSIRKQLSFDKESVKKVDTGTFQKRASLDEQKIYNQQKQVITKEIPIEQQTEQSIPPTQTSDNSTQMVKNTNDVIRKEQNVHQPAISKQSTTSSGECQREKEVECDQSQQKTLTGSCKEIKSEPVKQQIFNVQSKPQSATVSSQASKEPNLQSHIITNYQSPAQSMLSTQQTSNVEIKPSGQSSLQQKSTSSPKLKQTTTVQSQSSTQATPSHVIKQTPLTQSPALKQQTSLTKSPASKQQTTLTQSPAIKQQTSVTQSPALKQQTTLTQSPAIKQQTSLTQSPALKQQTTCTQSPGIKQPTPTIQSQTSINQAIVESQTAIKQESTIQSNKQQSSTVQSQTAKQPISTTKPQPLKQQTTIQSQVAKQKSSALQSQALKPAVAKSETTKQISTPQSSVTKQQTGIQHQHPKHQNVTVNQPATTPIISSTKEQSSVQTQVITAPSVTVTSSEIKAQDAITIIQSQVKSSQQNARLLTNVKQQQQATPKQNQTNIKPTVSITKQSTNTKVGSAKQPSPLRQQPSPVVSRQQPTASKQSVLSKPQSQQTKQPLSGKQQQPSVTRKQISPTRKQPSPNKQQPSPIRQQPSPTRKQPSPNNIQLSSGKQVPSKQHTSPSTQTIANKQQTVIGNSKVPSFTKSLQCDESQNNALLSIKSPTIENSVLSLKTSITSPVTVSQAKNEAVKAIKLPLETHFPAEEHKSTSVVTKLQTEPPAVKKTTVAQDVSTASEHIVVTEISSKVTASVSDMPSKHLAVDKVSSGAKCRSVSENRTPRVVPSDREQDSMVGAALNRLHRRRSSESPTRDQINKKTFDIKSGHRDVGTLARKFGGSLDPSDASDQSRDRSPNLINTDVAVAEIEHNKVLQSSPIGAEMRTKSLRRTPERTVSLREEKRSTPERDQVLQRRSSASFRDNEVKRRKPRHSASTETPMDDELQKILNRRSNYLEDWEQQVASSEGESQTSADKSVADFEARLEKKKSRKHQDQVASGGIIVDKELSTMLEVRRINTDSESDTQINDQAIKRTESKISQEGKSNHTTTVKKAPQEDIKVTPILKTTSSFEMEISASRPETIVTSILKKTATDTDSKQVVSILKKDVSDTPISLQKESVRPILKKESATEKQISSILVHPDVKPLSNQQAVPILKTSHNFKLEKSKTLGEMPDLPSEAIEIKTKDVTKKTTFPWKQNRPTLRKAKTFDSVDDRQMDFELASVLKNRRAGSAEKEMSSTSSEPQEKQLLDDEAQGGDQDEEGNAKKLSVAERIFQMQTRIEESSLPVSKLGSGSLGTPKMKIISSKSMPTSPGVYDNVLKVYKPLVTMEEEDLLAKLTDVAQAEEKATERRHRFKKNRDDWRRRTQPITIEEVTEANALDSVSSFRSEILRHASQNLFKNQSEDNNKPKAIVKKLKGQEIFPQPLKKDRFKDRRKGNLQRYKSLPELNQIDESEIVSSFAADIKEKLNDGSIKTADQPAEEIVPVHIVKQTRSLFKQATILPAIIESKQVSGNRAHLQSQSPSSSVVQSKSVTSVSVDSKGDKLTLNQISNSSQSDATSSKKTVTSAKSVHKTLPRQDDDIFSSDSDFFDKLVEINARTLVNIKSTSFDQMETSVENILENLSGCEPSSPEDEMSKLSVLQKMSKFREMEENKQTEAETEQVKTPKSQRRLLNRKERLERSQTQPITEDELSSASVFAKNQKAEQEKEAEDGEERTTSEDERSNLSIAEKMALFSGPTIKTVEEVPEQPKRAAPTKKKSRKFQSRFKTQPITVADLEKARVSPLAMSLVKPPDPKLLQGLSFKEQRDFMAQNAQLTLTGEQQGLRSYCLEEVNKPKGILKAYGKQDNADLSNTDIKGILKNTTQTDIIIKQTQTSADIKGILKHKQSTDDGKTAVKGILKPEHDTTINGNKQESILKSSSVEDRVLVDSSSEYNTASESELPRDLMIHESSSADDSFTLVKDKEPSSQTNNDKNKDNHHLNHSDTKMIQDNNDQNFNDRIKNLDIKIVQDENVNQTNKAVKKDAVVSATTFLLSNSDTSDMESEQNVITVVSGVAGRPPSTNIVSMKSSVDSSINISTQKAGNVNVSHNSDINMDTKVVNNTKSTLDTSPSLKSSHKNGHIDNCGNMKLDTSSVKVTSKNNVDSNSNNSKGNKDYLTNQNESQNDANVDIHLKPLVINNTSVNRESRAHSGWTDSSTDEDSGGRRLKIKNEAVARRRMNREQRKLGERYHTQPITTPNTTTAADNDSLPSEDVAITDPSVITTQSASLLTPAARHHTQPITPEEKEAIDFEVMKRNSPARSSGSIADRLSSLQQHKDHDWRKRVGMRDSTSPSSDSEGSGRLKERQSQLIDKVQTVKLRERQSHLKSERPVSLADRMSCLEDAQKTWKGRIEESDASKFTVEGKMAQLGQVAASPLVNKSRGILQREGDVNRGTLPTTPLKLRPTNGQASTPKLDIPPDICLPTAKHEDKPLQLPVKQELEEAASTPNIPTSMKIIADDDHMQSEDSDEQDKENTVVTVPKADDETFQAFYTQSSPTQAEDKIADISIEDLDEIKSTNVLSVAKKARPQNRQARASRNPLKALAQRDDLRTEYESRSTGIAERELRRIKKEQIAGKACLATDALAALATKEDFDRVKLRATDASTPVSGGDRFIPFKDVMLLHVKGRRHCHCRLVQPVSSSINSGDCFLLKTPNKIYVWVGEYCNIIEKSKAVDIATMIQQKRDIGCKSPFDPVSIYENRPAMSSAKDFWEILGGQQPYQAPGPAEEDELYEMYMSEVNMVYRVVGQRLVAVKEYWGQPLKYEMLTEKDAFVFDFGTEVYIWMGKSVAVNDRKVAMKLTQEVWNKGYDYTNCEINPFSPLRTPDNGGFPLQANKRPPWALLAKVSQNMETILFKDKFIDWPDCSATVLLVKDGDADKPVEFAELVPCNVSEMLAMDTNPVDLVLEGSHIGRGDKWIETHDGIRREFEICTLDMTMWHVMEYEQIKMDKDSHGQFHEADTYVIRWNYMVTQSGIKSLKGQARHSLTGREKCAYFFWQGRHSSVTEKGASALMTVELDEERGPQIRVVQGKELPCFIQLFEGRMIVHRGRREEAETNTQGNSRLYLVRNEHENEALLLEVPPCVQSLRSRSSFLLLNVSSGDICIWHGAKSSSHIKARARECAENLKERCAPEVGMSSQAVVSINEVDEGSERMSFWRALGCSSSDRDQYHSFLKGSGTNMHSPRLYHLSSVSGTFSSRELINPARSEQAVCPFPVLQSDLYSVPQPAVFLLATSPMVYVWQGWWPPENEDGESTKTGSAESRLHTERILAMETAINYFKERWPQRTLRCELVYSGLEPQTFTNLFPTWEIDQTVKDSQLVEGRKDGTIVSIPEYLHKITHTKYTYAELQQRPLPEGVDPLKMEKYLTQDEFNQVLEMNSEQFYALPLWKQKNIKKDKALF